MATVEPVPGAAAAVADLGAGAVQSSEARRISSESERALIVADYHAGLEAALRAEQGVEVDSRAGERRERVLALLDRTGADRVVFLGDLAHFFGGPHGAERGEIEVLLEALADRVPVTVVKGNHDGDIETITGDGVDVTSPQGVRIGDVGLVHGHTWPAADVLAADVVCVGHEHPQVRLVDEVGGSRVERAWLRGGLSREPFAERHPDLEWTDPDLVVFPAFNELVGGTWINEGQDFLSPFLPEGLTDGQAYLLDGTRLGAYRAV